MPTLHRLTMPAWGRPRPLFRWLHRWLGLIAGLVLAVVGGTGAIMSFQDDLLRWMNPDVMQVAVPEGMSALPLPELVARIQTQKSSPRIATLRLSGTPGDSAWVGFRARGKPKGEFVNPYTGDLLGKARGEAFFHVVEDLHRRLLAGKTGKAITGASALIFLAILISGVIVRLRRAGLKYWFVPSGRGSWGARIHSLHSVLGVWFLLPFLLVTLTGLYWSYGWSRTLWHEAAGAPKGKPMPQKLAVANHEAPDLQAIAERLATLAATRVQIFWPAKPDEAMRVFWQDSQSPHGRAFNTLQLEPVTATVISDQPFASLPFGTQLVRSMFALHSGEYFGLTGVWIMFFVSLSLPLFFISGLWLYLRRRMRIKSDVPRAPVAAEATPVLVAYASQTGTAQSVAQTTSQQLLAAGQSVLFRPIEALRVDDLLVAKEALFVVSTYGEGEPPDHAQGVIEQWSSADRSLSHLRFAILALGDRQYPHFCSFGVALRDRLLLANAIERFPILKADQADPAVIQEWFAHLASRWRSTPATVDPQCMEWTLTQRQLLNPAGMGMPTFEIELALTAPQSENWQAGALIDITPQHTPERVARWLASAGLDGTQHVVYGGREQRLVDVLQHCELPERDPIASVPDVQSWLSTLRRLSPRSYSVASLPTDGVVRLLVRQVRTPEGELGVASGWLTSQLPIGQKLVARLRQNPSFLPMMDTEVPCLFIANGTGMAGIRAHIEARIAIGATRNWVILGERSPQDAYWQAQWRLWEAQGVIERMDWVYSRQPTSGAIRYVQHQLGTAHTTLKNYLDEGAVVFICGSARGMAPAVESVLSNVLGDEEWQAFRLSNRYRRDVY
jgi:sulfite reductase (NADPH) flavoprotein alpha-component